MTNFTDVTNISHLIGLWDFRGGATNKDTGLADGIAQNGHFEGGAFASHDQLRTDGHGDWFDASGPDHPFDLPRGTIELQFTQEAHKGTSPDTVVNRGEFCDARHEGYFGISVTLDGRVEVLHQMSDSDGGAKLDVSTAAHFFSLGDTLNVVYSWDKHTGATFTVENLTKGTSTTIQSDVTGLTLDVGDNDDENFTFGAREFDDGHYDEFFKGAIDYVAVFNKVIEPEAPTAPDFIVEGTNGADVIDAGYTGDPEGDLIDAGDNATGGDEDVVDAGAGDDTVLAGAADDTVFGGSGDDSVQGNDGNDVIFGDTSLGQADGNTASVRESLNWSQVGDPNGPNPIDNGDPINGFVQNTGNVDVTFSVLNPNGHVRNQFENTTQNTDGIDSGAETINTNSSLSSEAGGKGNTESYQLAFSSPVENVSFRINDIDGDGVVRVQAFDAANNPIEIELTAGNRLTLLDTDGVPGADTADSNGDYLADGAPEYSILVEIPGPVARIVITHSQNGANNSGVNVTDVFFDATVVVADPEGPGDDTLSGGAGDDLIYGETGDDSILGGTGNDTLFGDDAPVGTPVGPNLIVNGSFEDTSGMTATGYGFVANNGVIPGWTDTSGNAIDVHNDDRDGQVATDGENWLDLEASPGNNRVGQDVAGVQDGVSYRLTFDVSDSKFLTSDDVPEENLVNVYWGGQLIATIDPSNVGESDFETITLDLIGGAGDGSNRLEFEGLGREDNFGAAIDNVSLVQLSDVTGPAGNDTIEGGDGDDLIAGRGGNDDLSGGRGNDTILGGAGDIIVGGSGDDSIVIDPTLLDATGENDAAIAVDGSTEGTDRDTLDLTGFVAFRNLVQTPDADGDSTSGSLEVQNADGDWVPVTFTEIETLILPPKAPDGVVDGEEFGEVMGPGYNDANAPTDGGGDIIDGPDGLDDSIRGNGGDDTINAGAGNDTVDGGTGDDVVNGGTGDDSMDGGAGDDLVTGGFGNDTVLGGDGNDELRGNDGNDSIDGGDGNDSMGGAEGDDTVLGGAGNDTLSGGSGNDVLDGGDDADTINGNSGNDIITDFDGDNVINSGVEGSPDRGLPFVGFPDANPFDDRDTVTTGFGNDQITTGDDNDVIFSLGGDNTIDAGFDDDQVTTGDGNDFIVSGEGSDTVNAGGGNDTIFGGENAPLVNLIDDNVNPANNDPILENGDDLIDAGAGDDLVFGEDDNDTIFGGAGNDTLDGGIDDDVIEGGDGDDLIIGGQGADSLSGGIGNDTFAVGNFPDPIFGDIYREGVGDTIVGGEDVDGSDIDVLDLTGNVNFDIFFEDSIDPTGTSGESGRVVFFTDATKTVVQGELVFKEIEEIAGPICFTPGTLIATPRGEVPVENLREGDKVITRDNGIQEIRWVGNRTLDRAELAANPQFKPILVKKGSLGHGLPERDMVVSPQHRLLIANQMTELYFNETEVLVPAKHLLNKWGIAQLDTLRTTYVHFMFDRHEVVLSNGSWTESFQPGRQSMTTLGDDVRAEIFALFPELTTVEGMDGYVAARRSLKAHEAKLLQL